MSEPLKSTENARPIHTSSDSQGSSIDLNILGTPAGSVVATQSEKGLIAEDAETQEAIDPYIVTFDGPDDPENPLNWGPFWKWGITILTSCGGLVTLMSGAMMAPAIDRIGRDLKTSISETNLGLSIFVLSFAFGPLVLAPLSEVFGRRPIWLICSAFYVLWNTVCGFAQNKGLMIAARFMAGIGASAEFAIGYPVLNDLWRPEQRGMSFSIGTFIPFLGPAIGPIIAGAITQATTWRWLFWTVSIFDGILVLVGLIIFQECSASKILERKAKRLRKSTNDPNYTTKFERANPSMSQKLKISLTRPFRLLISQPILQLLSFFLAYNFGMLYIMLSTFASVYIDIYHQNISSSGLHYIAIALGNTIAAQVGAPLTDKVWAHLKKRHGGVTAPEYRVPLMVPGCVIIPVGLCWYGWSIQYKLHWIVTDIGAGFFSCGIILGTQAMQAYVMEAYPKYTASASAASQTLRSVLAFILPIFAPQMYFKLGYGWGNSTLAFIFLAVGLPAPLILWKFGARLRRKEPAW